MKVFFERVSERDVDFVIMRALLENEKVRQCFLSRIGKHEYRLERIQHSLMTQHGESDITAVFSCATERIALLIENKIDAIAMPEQHARYHLRGKEGADKDLYDRYEVFITAPQKYLDENSEAQKYENRISYEELSSLFPEASFDGYVLTKAIEEKDRAYTPVEDQSVTAFWQNFYDFCESQFPMLHPYVFEGPRGTNAVWATFKTPVKKTKIQYKADRGYADLEIGGYAENRQRFVRENGYLLDADMTVEVAGKSLAIRLKAPRIDFHRNFYDSVGEMRVALSAVVRLQELLDKIAIER